MLTVITRELGILLTWWYMAYYDCWYKIVETRGTDYKSAFGCLEKIYVSSS